MNTAARPLRALIYARKSTPDPRNPGRSRSTEEQLLEARKWCDREGWHVVGEEIDDGVSASRYAKGKRPAWERVTQRLRRGEVDVLVTWEASRATRDMEAYAELRRLCESTGTRWGYDGRLYDLAEREDRFRTGLDALVAEDEAARTRERVLRAVRANARAGHAHGRRPFGYLRTYDPHSGAPTGQIPHPEEAPIVADIVERVARGESMRGLAEQLNQDGYVTATGSPWTASTVRRTARNLHYAGIRIHRGAEIPGTWEPIVPEALVRAAIARTDGNDRSRMMPSSTPVHLLSGIARCGICGEKLFRGHNYRYRDLEKLSDSEKLHVYVCRTRSWTDPDTGKHYGIGHIGIRKEPTDEVVLEAVSAYLARTDVADAIVAAGAGDIPEEARVVAELRQRLEDAAAAYSRGELSVAMLAAIEAGLRPQIEKAEREARRSTLPPVVAEALGRDFRSLPLAEQREVVSAVAEVVILPGRRTRSYDPTRVSIRWKV